MIVGGITLRFKQNFDLQITDRKVRYWWEGRKSEVPAGRYRVAVRTRPTGTSVREGFADEVVDVVLEE